MSAGGCESIARPVIILRQRRWRSARGSNQAPEHGSTQIRDRNVKRCREEAAHAIPVGTFPVDSIAASAMPEVRVLRADAFRYALDGLGIGGLERQVAVQAQRERPHTLSQSVSPRRFLQLRFGLEGMNVRAAQDVSAFQQLAVAS